MRNKFPELDKNQNAYHKVINIVNSAVDEQKFVWAFRLLLDCAYRSCKENNEILVSFQVSTGTSHAIPDSTEIELTWVAEKNIKMTPEEYKKSE